MKTTEQKISDLKALIANQSAAASDAAIYFNALCEAIELLELLTAQNNKLKMELFWRPEF